MISALEIGTVLFPALALAALIVGHVSSLPKPKRVPIRVRHTDRRHRPDA